MRLEDFRKIQTPKLLCFRCMREISMYRVTLTDSNTTIKVCVCETCSRRLFHTDAGLQDFLLKKTQR